MPNAAKLLGAIGLAIVWVSAPAGGSPPMRALEGMVVSENATASTIGAAVMREGGSAVDAAVATALAMAVTHPRAGNIGGGGFLLYHGANGETVAYDFRETAPAAASPTMWLRDGEYDAHVHHYGHQSVGVPGTVAGLHAAWSEHGRLPWRRLVEPAIGLAADGFNVTDDLAGSLASTLPLFGDYPSSLAQFSRGGQPYAAGDRLRQLDLARTLRRIAAHGPTDFYQGETAKLMVRDMQAHAGLITLDDLKAYRAKRRTPIRGTYRGYEILAMPPPSSGGTAIVQILNILEGYDLAAAGSESAQNYHRYAEAMRRAFADRARYLGDPDTNPDMPIARLISKEYAGQLRQSINERHASPSAANRFEWSAEGNETTHISVVDVDRCAVALTYTLEQSYGSGIVVPDAGFLLNNEMGDFNARPGLTDATGLIGTDPNLAEPGKRMLSSMSPTIVLRDNQLAIVTGSPGGRTIINTVAQAIINVIDFGMNVQEAVDAPRMHHQWLPDEIAHERFGFSPDTLTVLRQMGHRLAERDVQGSVQMIVVNHDLGVLEGGTDRRSADGAAVGQ